MNQKRKQRSTSNQNPEQANPRYNRKLARESTYDVTLRNGTVTSGLILFWTPLEHWFELEVNGKPHRIPFRSVDHISIRW